MDVQSEFHEQPGTHLAVRLFRFRTAPGNPRYSAIARAWADRRGVTAILTAVALVALVAVIGLAVDVTRLIMVQARLKTAVDAAALVGARDISLNKAATTALYTKNATDLFWVNFGRSSALSTQGYLGTSITAVTVTQISPDSVSMEADALVPTTLLNIVGIANIPLNVTSQATRAATGLELALVLDNTGSMAGWPIQSVITSASNLVNILYGNGTVDTLPNLWISVVPFTAEVNVGANNSAWLRPGGNIVSDFANARWMGCVMARYDTVDAATGLTNDFTDVPPTVAPFAPFLYPSTYGLYTRQVNGTVISFGDNDWQPGRITESQQSTIAQNTAVGPNLGCSQNNSGGALPILAGSASKTAALSVINQMVANFRGGTFINLGLQAGWWTLSPRWRGAAGWGDAKLPLDYHTPLMQKVIVLMTDGNNEWYDYPDRAPGACNDPRFNPAGNCPVANWTGTGTETNGDTDFAGYGRLLDNRMGLPANQNTKANATTNINNKMSQLCTIIKQQGITIYTILFNHGGSVSSGTKTLFQSCASKPEFYFLDVTDAQLQATFSSIGEQLASLRISK